MQGIGNAACGMATDDPHSSESEGGMWNRQKKPQSWIQMWVHGACWTLEFHPRFVTSPLLQKANPAPALGTFPLPGREKNHSGHGLSAPSAAPQPGRFSQAPFFRMHSSCQGVGRAKVTSSHLCPHLYFSTCRTSPQLQGEQPHISQHCWDTGMCDKVITAGAQGERAQPCPGPAGSTHSSFSAPGK